MIVEEPPDESSSSGMPVTGMMPMAMPTFSKTENTNMPSTPTHSSIPKVSRAIWAMRQIR